VAVLKHAAEIIPLPPGAQLNIFATFTTGSAQALGVATVRICQVVGNQSGGMLGAAGDEKLPWIAGNRIGSWPNSANPKFCS
jgi:hypothetical protein